MYRERRQNARWTLAVRAVLRLKGQPEAIDCQLRDINFKGLQVVLSANLPADTFLSLSLYVQDRLILDAEVWVVWYKGIAGLNAYGFYFSKIRDADKETIYHLVNELSPQEVARRHWQGIGGIKGGVTMNDRRIFERFARVVPLRLLDLGSGKDIRTQTQDISVKGLGMTSDQEVSPFSRVEVWLEVPQQQPLYARGEIAWVMPLKQGFRLGVNLEKADLMGLGRALSLGIKRP
jgi:hypothetical protein